ncbi:MAG: hypothetical protein KAU52_04205 [Methanosarcinales archaeon]|nr:hypothetical protein [Methanosarcinales archaeon]
MKRQIDPDRGLGLLVSPMHTFPSMLSFATMPLYVYAAPTVHSSQQVCFGFLSILDLLTSLI